MNDLAVVEPASDFWSCTRILNQIDTLRQEVRARGGTEQVASAYAAACLSFCRFHKPHSPEELRGPDVEKFLTNWASVEQKPSDQVAQARRALLFF